MARTSPLARLAERNETGGRRGITAVCSANPFVLEAALGEAAGTGAPVLIEATCNQVNHRGGYTGWTPADFAGHVAALAAETAVPAGQVLLGGDHLGPNPWRSRPAEEAMRESERMIAAYVAAGFAKLHLDTSMPCADDPVALPEATIAARAARLAAAAEHAAAATGAAPFYVVGTEVPPPGGAHEVVDSLEVTRPEAALRTMALHREAFRATGVGHACERVIALVVQPGVEFGSANVAPYRPEKARALSACLDELPGLVFEAHSTDYQPVSCLAALVDDGFAILKVGPALTFALRECLYGLDAAARFLDPGAPSLVAAMEALMCGRPADWQPYYGGSPEEQRIARHFSYSDRIRYYWSLPEARAAVDDLLARLGDRPLPETMVSQYLPRLYPRVAEGSLAGTPRALIDASIRDVLGTYRAACR